MRISLILILLFLAIGAAQAQTYFLAVDIPHCLEGPLDLTKKQLERKLYGNFSNKQQFHITLKYFGRLAPKRLQKLKQQLSGILQQSKTFNIKLHGLGFFPSATRARVAWVGVNSPKLFTLRQNIVTALAKFGHPREGKKFTPHVTLARLSYPPPKWLISELQQKIEQTQALEFKVNKIMLLKSAGGKYTEELVIKLVDDKTQDK